MIPLIEQKSRMTKKIIPMALFIFMFAPLYSNAGSHDAKNLVEAGFHYMRDKASVSRVDMTIHRSDWQRIFTLKAWTLGDKESLFTIISPAKDADNGTLKKGRQMWMYNPKINRVIKLPPSLMSQSWMGSDFSNNDLAKSDSLINEYTHTIIGTERHEGKKVFIVKSIPKPKAPVVWGMQELKIREDNLFLEQAFYDEDLRLVKVLKFLEIQMLGGKLYPKKLIMQKVDNPEKYTVVEYKTLLFKESLPAGLFTLSNLKKPKR
jgi:outer membrane lipoprotein-sorting protein